MIYFSREGRKAAHYIETFAETKKVIRNEFIFSINKSRQVFNIYSTSLQNKEDKEICLYEKGEVLGFEVGMT